MGDKKLFFFLLLLITAIKIEAQLTIKSGSLLRIDIRKDTINYADTIWNWESYQSSDRYIINKCQSIFNKKDNLFILTSRDSGHYYIPSLGSRVYKIINTLSKKEFFVAHYSSVIDVIGEPYINQFGKIIPVDNGFWFLGGSLQPSTYFDENDSTYQFKSRSEEGIRLTHILGKIGKEYLIAVRREPKNNYYDYYLSDFSSLPSLSLGRKIIFSNSKDIFCLPSKIELLQDSLYVIEYECTSNVDLALLSKDSLKTISENVSLPNKRLLKNSELIYTEFNSSNNSFDLYKSFLNREKLIFEKKKKLLSGLSSLNIVDTSIVAWIRNDSLFVFDFESQHYLNKYTLNRITIEPAIFFANPYIILDQILLISDVKKEEDLSNDFSLSQNYPNPFNPTTTIKYTIPSVRIGHASSLQKVILKVYDLLGREVTTLVDEYKPEGVYEVTFNGSALTSGVYFYRLIVEGSSQTRKMLYLK